MLQPGFHAIKQMYCHPDYMIGRVTAEPLTPVNSATDCGDGPQKDLHVRKTQSICRSHTAADLLGPCLREHGICPRLAAGCIVGRHLFVILKRSHCDLSAFRICDVDGFGVVAQGFLGLSAGVSGFAGTLSPGVAVQIVGLPL